MLQAERQLATVGLLMFGLAAFALRHTGGKPLKMLGFTVLTVKAAVWAMSVGAVLVVFALLLANPGER